MAITCAQEPRHERRSLQPLSRPVDATGFALGLASLGGLCGAKLKRKLIDQGVWFQ